MNANTYICPRCEHPVRMASKPKRSFMGFARIPCPSCKTEFRYPLTIGTVVFYWILLFWNVALVGYILSQGEGFTPKPIGIVLLIYFVVSLVKNSSLKRSITELNVSAIGAPALQVAAVEGESEERARWYHLLLALMFPFVALPWGIVNLCMKKRGSGLMLTIPSAIILLMFIKAVVSSSR